MNDNHPHPDSLAAKADDDVEIDLTPFAKDHHDAAHPHHILSQCTQQAEFFKKAAIGLQRAHADFMARSKAMSTDDFPVIFSSEEALPKTFARITQAANSLGVGWKISHRPDTQGPGFLYQLDIHDLPPGFSQVSSSHSSHRTIDGAIEHLAEFLADAIYRRGAGIKHIARQMAERPSTYSLRELRRIVGYEIGHDTTVEAVAMGGALLEEAVRYLRDLEWTQEDRLDTNGPHCAICGGYPSLVLPGDPALRAGHQRGCRLGLFLSKFEGLISDGIGRPRH